MNKTELRHVIGNFLFNEDIDDYNLLLVKHDNTLKLMNLEGKRDKDTEKLLYNKVLDLEILKELYNSMLDDQGLTIGSDFDLYHGHFLSKSIDMFLDEEFD